MAAADPSSSFHEPEPTQTFNVPLHLFEGQDAPRPAPAPPPERRRATQRLSPVRARSSAPAAQSAKGSTPPAERATKAAPASTELSEVLEQKIRHMLAMERKREAELAQARGRLQACTTELMKEVERVEAAERRLAQKQRALDELIQLVKTLEDDREAAKGARVALETLKLSYASNEIRGPAGGRRPPY